MISNLYLRAILFLAIAYFLGGCKSAKKVSYSFNVERYVVDTAKHLLDFSSLLSYGNYLFEYKIHTHYTKVIKGEGEPLLTAVYDTTGVYLLSGKNKLYCEFDSFSLKSNILSKGPFSSKLKGATVTPVRQVSADSSDTYYKPPQSMVLNNIPCYYSDIVFKNAPLKDTVQQSVLLIKKENLNSLYKIRGIEFMDPAYSIVGFRKTHLLKTDLFEERINNLRPLTEKEIEICKYMIKLSGL